MALNICINSIKHFIFSFTLKMTDLKPGRAAPLVYIEEFMDKDYPVALVSSQR